SLYKARKPWPPDFSKLTPKHKFSLERRYRRRMKLKFARPKLHRTVRLAQMGGIAFVLVYGVLMQSWDGDKNVFSPVR
ncbi:hypothetical protein BDZ91DRAFT_632754, partial [Kalaharituber pfeilii]